LAVLPSIQIGLLPRQSRFFEFKAVIDGALKELEDVLHREDIVARSLSVPLGFGNSTGDFATLLGQLSRSDGSLEAFTLMPRKLRQYAGAPAEVDRKQPLVGVIETDTSLRLTKALLLHEFGHARKDYPRVWELLESTSDKRFISQIGVF
jgi:hypothetical protein